MSLLAILALGFTAQSDKCIDHGKPCTSSTDKCCAETHKGVKPYSLPYSCVPWGDAMECRAKGHETCAVSGEWCHGSATKHAPYACCDSSEVCSKTDADNWTCKPKAAEEFTCIEHGAACTDTDTCCPENVPGVKPYSVPYTCVPWGDAPHKECRAKGHETCAVSGEWCHGSATKHAPYACCDSSEVCSKTDAFNWTCKPKAAEYAEPVEA